MPEPVEPSIGLGVLHLFAKQTGPVEIGIIRTGMEKLQAADGQVVPVAMLGHKADVAFMCLHRDLWTLRGFQQEVGRSGLTINDSYVSVTETSEYSQDVPEKMLQMRLHPKLPPQNKPAWCFYPMSKRRGTDGQNWYAQPYEKRRELMMAHGMTGRKFAGRILQVVTGSTGLDDHEWGVTLFGEHPDVLKEVVYTMRYDKASAHFADFGPFYTGMVTDIDNLL